MQDPSWISQYGRTTLAFGCLAVLLSTRTYFWLSVGPAALRRWAEGRGYTIVRRRWCTLRDRLGHRNTRMQWLYRLVIADTKGREYDVLAIVEQTHFYTMTPEGCRVGIRWTDAGQAPEPNLADRVMWDRELD